jgi:hypothetical protein
MQLKVFMSTEEQDIHTEDFICPLYSIHELPLSRDFFCNKEQTCVGSNAILQVTIVTSEDIEECKSCGITLFSFPKWRLFF